MALYHFWNLRWQQKRRISFSKKGNWEGKKPFWQHPSFPRIQTQSNKIFNTFFKLAFPGRRMAGPDINFTLICIESLLKKYYFLKSPNPTLVAFTGVTNAHGPSPQQTACRSPSCSLTTATGRQFWLGFKCVRMWARGLKVVGSNPSTVYWMVITFFHIYLL